MAELGTPQSTILETPLPLQSGQPVRDIGLLTSVSDATVPRVLDAATEELKWVLEHVGLTVSSLLAVDEPGPGGVQMPGAAGFSTQVVGAVVQMASEYSGGNSEPRDTELDVPKLVAQELQHLLRHRRRRRMRHRERS